MATPQQQRRQQWQHAGIADWLSVIQHQRTAQAANSPRLVVEAKQSTSIGSKAGSIGFPHIHGMPLMPYMMRQHTVTQ